jgi:hypothetical protein
MRLTEYIAGMGEMRNACKILARKPKWKRPQRKWKDNIKTNLVETGCEGMEVSYGNDNEPSNSHKSLGNSWPTECLLTSQRTLLHGVWIIHIAFMICSEVLLDIRLVRLRNI